MQYNDYYSLMVIHPSLSTDENFDNYILNLVDNFNNIQHCIDILIDMEKTLDISNISDIIRPSFKHNDVFDDVNNSMSQCRLIKISTPNNLGLLKKIYNYLHKSYKEGIKIKINKDKFILLIQIKDYNEKEKD